VKALRWLNFKVAIHGIGLGWNFDVKSRRGGGDLVGNFNLNGLMHRRNLIYISRLALWRTLILRGPLRGGILVSK
jgi:hypothetical protein